ncbi:hypothetical protein BESB_069650 [Besnoitia besnoiti]|uniref:Uncharacterized protein n=1 Tax=Besnoitia besnoiti TaxID=94643 RepID=A0A2A9MHQ8_BESBE|nr:hypothetical protein BESB_069650 [Besnoitia besnoiti]PFH34932.1 hypothetical protein BESB_069650 [Besnoitia besnoiti]
MSFFKSKRVVAVALLVGLSATVDAAPAVADPSVESFFGADALAEESYIDSLSQMDGVEGEVDGHDDKDKGKDKDDGKDKKRPPPPPPTTTTTTRPTTTTRRPPSKHIPAPPTKHVPPPPSKHMPPPPAKHTPAPPTKHVPHPPPAKHIPPPAKHVPAPPAEGTPVPVPVPSPVMTKAKFKKLLLLLMLGSQRFKKIMSDEDHNGVAELIRDYDTGKLEDLEHMLWESYQESAGTEDDFATFFRQLKDVAME